MLALPAHLHARGTALVAVDRASRSEIEAHDLLRLDAALAWRARPADLPGADPLRPAHAFLGVGTPGRLTLRTEPLRREPSPGLIREATLVTTAPGAGPSRRRLTLAVEPCGAPELALTLPEGSAPETVVLDGQPVTPTRREGCTLAIRLPASRPACTISLGYRAGGPDPTDGLRPEAPRFSMPCLALDWEIACPGPWSAADPGSSLVPADPPSARAHVVVASLLGALAPSRMNRPTPASRPRRRRTSTSGWPRSRPWPRPWGTGSPPGTRGRPRWSSTGWPWPRPAGGPARGSGRPGRGRPAGRWSRWACASRRWPACCWSRPGPRLMRRSLAGRGGRGRRPRPGS